MDDMGPRSSRSRLREISSLSVLFTLLVQFAPSLHALVSHHDPSSGDGRAATLPQVVSEQNDTDICILCTLLLTRHAPLLPVRIEIGDLITVRSITSPLPSLPDTSDFGFAHSRGPPLTL